MRHNAGTRLLLAALVAAGGAATPAAVQRSDFAPTLFASSGVLEFQLEAPFDDLFGRADRAPGSTVPGRLAYTDDSGQLAWLERVHISVRGNTSRRSTECPFPKLKLAFKSAEGLDRSPFRGMHAVKIGTHCDDRPDGQLTFQFGRWPNERSPLREALVYRLVEITGVAVPRSRLARITYIFRPGTSPRAAQRVPKPPVTRYALLLEDEADSFARLGISGELIAPGGEPANDHRAIGAFDNAQRHFSPLDSARAAFAQAMVGNFDWALKFNPGDGYRDDAKKGLWNVLALVRADRTAIPFLFDFDLAGIVTGRHLWYGDVFPDRFARAHSPAAVEVLAQVQRTRSLFDRRVLDDTRRAFLARKERLLAAMSGATIDPGGRANAETYLRAFFDAIESDQAFYGPVVSRTDVIPFASADMARPSCGPKDAVPIGTPVAPAPAQPSGPARVQLLDVFWHWVDRCAAGRQAPVWIDAAGVVTAYPAK